MGKVNYLNSKPIIKFNFFKFLWIIAGVVALLVFIVATLRMAGIVYEQTRELTNLGIYTFKTTGEINVKQEQRTERVTYKTSKTRTVTNYYAVYLSENKQYRFEKRLDSGNITILRNIRNKKTVYRLEREVWQDKSGNIEFKEPGYQVQTRSSAMREGLFKLLILIASGVICFFSFKNVWLSKNSKQPTNSIVN